MPKDSDFIQFEKDRKEDMAYARELTKEELVAVDITKSIESKQRTIDLYKDDLVRLKEALSKLPTPPKRALNLDQSILKHRISVSFRRKINELSRLYGFK